MKTNRPTRSTLVRTSSSLIICLLYHAALGVAFLRLPAFLPTVPVAEAAAESLSLASVAAPAASISSTAGLYACDEVAGSATGAGVAAAAATRFGSAWPMAGTAVARTVWKGAAINVPALSNHSEKGREIESFAGVLLDLEVTVISTL